MLLSADYTTNQPDIKQQETQICNIHNTELCKVISVTELTKSSNGMNAHRHLKSN